MEVLLQPTSLSPPFLFSLVSWVNSLANKQDLPEAISEQAVQELLQLELLESNPWAVYPCTALLEEGSEPDSRIIQGYFASFLPSCLPSFSSFSSSLRFSI